jgi:hypothetical protein
VRKRCKIHESRVSPNLFSADEFRSIHPMARGLTAPSLNLWGDFDPVNMFRISPCHVQITSLTDGRSKMRRWDSKYFKQQFLENDVACARRIKLYVADFFFASCLSDASSVPFQYM